MTLLAWGFLVALITLNLMVSWGLLTQGDRLTIAQQFGQLLFVWLVPLIGALFVGEKTFEPRIVVAWLGAILVAQPMSILGLIIFRHMPLSFLGYSWIAYASRSIWILVPILFVLNGLKLPKVQAFCFGLTAMIIAFPLAHFTALLFACIVLFQC